MKLFKTFVATSVLAISALVPAFAASPSLSVSVPFPFMVGTQRMAAGDYTVHTSDDSGVILIQGEGHGVAVISSPLSTGSALSAHPGLVFRDNGGVRYLVGVKLSDDSSRSIPEHAFDRANLEASR